MPRVRAGGSQKWANRTAAATGDYQTGVANPRQSWQQASVAAADAHKAATTLALNEGRFAKGVTKAGDAKWQRNAAGKGAERFGPGAAAGVADYEAGVAPFLQVIESTQLPPRGPKGDPRNIQRVATLAAALHKRKTGSVLLFLVVLVAALALVVLAAVSGDSLRRSALRLPATRAEDPMAGRSPQAGMEASGVKGGGVWVLR